jgi:hypothetical protein
MPIVNELILLVDHALSIVKLARLPSVSAIFGYKLITASSQKVTGTS